MPDAVVVGAGVVGLTTALRLLEAGRSVSVLTADPPEATTSAVAAAIWYPYRAEPRASVLAWGTRSARVFADLAEDPATGVRIGTCLELLRAARPDPWWRGAVERFDRVGPADVPAGYAAGWRLRLPIVAMPVYLPWLAGRVAAAGGRIERRRVDALEALTAEADLVVNCTGLGARALAGDRTVTAVRGQVVIVRNPGLTEALLAQEDPAAPTYVVPRGRDCVLGGTAQEGVEDTAPDPCVAADILARCRALEPRLEGCDVLGHRAGLRPVRPAVRLELAALGRGRCLHHYGHGGAGVTLSWGAAEAAVALLDA